jgi:hypothetical protein
MAIDDWNEIGEKLGIELICFCVERMRGLVRYLYKVEILEGGSGNCENLR